MFRSDEINTISIMSNGHNTVLCIDGQPIDGVKSVSFKHSVADKGKVELTATIDLNFFFSMRKNRKSKLASPAATEEANSSQEKG